MVPWSETHRTGTAHATLDSKPLGTASRALGANVSSATPAILVSRSSGVPPGAALRHVAASVIPLLPATTGFGNR